ncbi:23S rRNA (adenine(1618)-N(6))-methyltransferase RlmF [Glaciecola petra]|uniref:Ribosomal RNA large subunit methyltransferase F n=1 Tax=Glaciecola petra TaxID=3075602 RepID=A0ABU2ZS33_9ALTE|nr:23S rRNA (adenine(1618)-N(6))-methyltransferase RlmF [Aestuariibacter sp. P117]MDT0595442.1 23S rRNA (adenine(1618)-N(6))-methyltransferase RlmF [Aestuariibacter sp. P117]
MHHRNIHRNAYDFDALIIAEPPLEACLTVNHAGRKTIDFANPLAVKLLNKALLKHHYGIDFWDIPDGYLCPPVPGRADYIHALADLLSDSGVIDDKSTKAIRGLDIGTGANLIYPILGSQIYNWKFVASDIDRAALQSASLLVDANKALYKKIIVRPQSNNKHYFKTVVASQDSFSFSMCNPPFHASAAAANEGSLKKKRNLGRHKLKRIKSLGLNKEASSHIQTLNFSGQAKELWCDGGELRFIKNMILESLEFKKQIVWFTSLISNKKHVAPIIKYLQKSQVKEHRVVEMAQGNKMSRFIAWRF